MQMSRRAFAIHVAMGLGAAVVPAQTLGRTEDRMYGLIGKMLVTPGQRDIVVAALLEGSQSMPGCLSYVVAHDASDPDAIWITEVWDSKESHHASLSLPSVQEAIARVRPMISGFGERFETVPIGGAGVA
jgi:quinol monooxygenase YgiN